MCSILPAIALYLLTVVTLLLLYNYDVLCHQTVASITLGHPDYTTVLGRPHCQVAKKVDTAILDQHPSPSSFSWSVHILSSWSLLRALLGSFSSFVLFACCFHTSLHSLHVRILDHIISKTLKTIMLGDDKNN